MTTLKKTIIGAALSALIGPAPFVATAARAQQVQPGAPDPAAVAALVDNLVAALNALPGTATQVDAEAALAFAIDQAKQPQPVSIAALNVLKTKKKWSRAILNAINKTLAAGAGGTGGIGGPSNGNANALGNGPSAGGGAGTDYSNNQ